MTEQLLDNPGDVRVRQVLKAAGTHHAVELAHRRLGQRWDRRVVAPDGVSVPLTGGLRRNAGFAAASPEPVFQNAFGACLGDRVVGRRILFGRAGASHERAVADRAQVIDQISVEAAGPGEAELLVAGGIGALFQVVPHLADRIALVDEALRKRTPRLHVQGCVVQELAPLRSILFVARVPFGRQYADRPVGRARLSNEAVLPPAPRPIQGPQRRLARAIDQHDRSVQTPGWRDRQDAVAAHVGVGTAPPGPRR